MTTQFVRYHDGAAFRTGIVLDETPKKTTLLLLGDRTLTTVRGSDRRYIKVLEEQRPIRRLATLKRVTIRRNGNSVRGLSKTIRSALNI